MTTDTITQPSHSLDDAPTLDEVQPSSPIADPPPPPKKGRQGPKNNPSPEIGDSEKTYGRRASPKTRDQQKLNGLARSLSDLRMFAKAFADCARRIEREARPYLKQAEQLEKLTRLEKK